MRPWGAGGRGGTSSARRWPRSCWASASTSTAAATTSSSRITRTRRRRRARRAAPSSRGSGCTTGCCRWATRRWRSRSATSRGCGDVVERWGRDALIWFFCTGHYRQPLAFTDETLEQATATVARVRELGRRLTPARRRANGAADGALLRRARRRLQHARGAGRAVRVGPGGQPAHRRWPSRRRRRSARDARRARAGEPARRRPRRPSEVVALAARREQARAARDFAESDRLRDEIAALGWVVRDVAGGFELRPARVIVYGRQPVRELLRARRRRVTRVWATSARPRRSRWPTRRRGRRAGRDRRSSPAATTTRASAPRPRATRTSGRPSCWRADDPLLVALDEVQDPQNLGAIARSAEVRRRNRPGHCRSVARPRSRRRPARRRRAPSSICGSPASATSPTSSATRSAAGLWCYGADAAGVPYLRADYSGGRRARDGRRGERPATAGRQGLRRARRAAAPRARSSR